MNQFELARANESTEIANWYNNAVGRRDSLDIDGLIVDGGIHNYANPGPSSYANSDMLQAASYGQQGRQEGTQLTAGQWHLPAGSSSLTTEPEGGPRLGRRRTALQSKLD